MFKSTTKDNSTPYLTFECSQRTQKSTQSGPFIKKLLQNPHDNKSLTIFFSKKAENLLLNNDCFPLIFNTQKGIISRRKSQWRSETKVFFLSSSCLWHFVRDFFWTKTNCLLKISWFKKWRGKKFIFQMMGLNVIFNAKRIVLFGVLIRRMWPEKSFF